MKLTLLPIDENRKDLVDYTHGIIVRHYQADISKYCFTLYPEQYSDDGALVPTDRYFAVMVTPKGIRAFYVVKNVSGNYIIDYDADNTDSPEQKLAHLNGFTSEYASALQKEISQQAIQLRDYMKMLNVAVKEHIGVL